MSDYAVKVWPQSQFRFVIYDNIPKHKRAKDVLKANPGAKAAINLAYFALKDMPEEGVKAYDHQADVKIKGKWEYGPRWPDVVGLCIDESGNISAGRVRDDAYEYAAAKTVNYLDGQAVVAPGHTSEGLTYYAFKTNGALITFVVGKDNNMPPAEAVQILRNMGAVTILEYDGSWSSQAAWDGVDISPSQQRTDRTWLLIYPRYNQNEEKPMDGIKKKYMTQNPCYLSQSKRDKHDGMLHSTAASGAMAQAIFDGWNKPGAEAGVEFIIDDTGIYQTLPLGIKSAHAGTAAAGKVSANNTHVACEICEPWETIFLPINWRPLSQGGKYNKPYPVKRLQQELTSLSFDPKGVDGSFGPGCTAAVKAYQASVGIPADGNVGPTTLKYLQKREGSYLRYNAALADEYFKKVYGYAVTLFAWLGGEIGLEPGKIVCHSEGFKLGIASNHADVLHWFPQHGKSMDTFRADVAAAIAGTILPANPLGDAVDKLAAAGIIAAADYWKGGNYSAANVQALLIKIAAAI